MEHLNRCITNYSRAAVLSREAIEQHVTQHTETGMTAKDVDRHLFFFSLFWHEKVYRSCTVSHVATNVKSQNRQPAFTKQTHNSLPLL